MNTPALDRPIAQFRRRDNNDELARINRLTGLVFESVPRSLLKTREQARPVTAPASTTENAVVVAWKRGLRPAG